MTHTITVVIPAFNSERFLDRCLDSIQRQTLREMEILCIDDGSTDRTPEILRNRADADERIRIITLPENHGVPYARNLAIDEAHGKYLYYMDSDDWIDPDYLSEMYLRAERTGQDVIINGNWFLEYDDPPRRQVSGRFGFVREEAGFYPTATVQARFYPTVWSRLYKLQYIKDNDIRSPLLKGGVEDNYFTSLAEILQERSYIFNGPFYHYFQREGSLVRQPDAAFRHFENFRVFLDELHRRAIPPQAARRFYAVNNLEVDTPERFEFLKKYFSDVEADVRSCPELYELLDVFLLKAFVSAPDFEAFKARYGSVPQMKFAARILRDRSYPTLSQVLDGAWSLDSRTK